MTDGRGARQRVLVVAAYPALRAGLVSLLGSDPELDPVAAEGAELEGDSSSALAAIVVDYSAGEPEEFVAAAETFPGAPLVLIGADPATDGPGLSGAPVAYLPSDVDASALAAAVRAAAAGLIVLDPTVAGATGVHAHSRTSEGGETLTTRE
ncbi:MAG: DNA-binding response regulator, partial [Chloroflexi bacterium]|nr:DNA-binding response regulator [Chloroflexota bacterium]